MHEGEAFGAIIAQAKKALEDKPAAAEEDFLPLDGGGWAGVTSDVEPHVVRHPSLTLPIKGRGKEQERASELRLRRPFCIADLWSV